MARKKILLAITGLALFAVVLPTLDIAAAEEQEEFRYGLSGNNLVFTTAEEAAKGGTFKLTVRGGSAAEIKVELVDVYADESGAKKPFPLGSSPFSPKGLVRFDREFPDYVPSRDFQNLEVAIRFKKPLEISSPILGGLKISFTGSDNSSAGIRVQSSIVATFAYYPGGNTSLTGIVPKVTLTDVLITRTSQDFFPFNLIPDLPFLWNRGPIFATYKIQNSGNIFLRSSSELLVTGLSLFGSNEVLYRFQSEPGFLVPNQFESHEVDFQPNQMKEDYSGIPASGIFQIDIIAEGFLTEEVSATATNSTLVIIFPWKYWLVGILILILLRRVIGAQIRRFTDFVKSFIEFRRRTGAESEAPVAVKMKDSVPDIKGPYLSSSRNNSTDLSYVRTNYNYPPVISPKPPPNSDGRGMGSEEI